MSAFLLAAYLAPAWVPSEFNYGTDMWAYHGLFSVSVLRACAA